MKKGRFSSYSHPFAKLARLLERNGFYDLQPRYDRAITHGGFETTRVTRDGKRYEVSNYADAGPFELWVIQRSVESVAPLVRSSHERFDGGGYPDALAGDDIPLGARIVAVCDSYDAMITDRVYRAGRSPEEALAELRRCAGSQFDPRVVAAFAAVLAEREVGSVQRVHSC